MDHHNLACNGGDCFGCRNVAMGRQTGVFAHRPWEIRYHGPYSAYVSHPFSTAAVDSGSIEFVLRLEHQRGTRAVLSYSGLLGSGMRGNHLHSRQAFGDSSDLTNR